METVKSRNLVFNCRVTCNEKYLPLLMNGVKQAKIWLLDLSNCLAIPIQREFFANIDKVEIEKGF